MTTRSAITCMLMLAALSLTIGVARADQPLNIYIGQGQMPFADDNPQNRGLYGDLMDELCRRLQRECQYQNVPWKRVQLIVAGDPNGIVLNMGRTPEREQHFVWLLEVLPTAYVLASTSRRFNSLSEALDAGPLVVMAGTPRALEAQALRRPGQTLVEVTHPEQAARMLQSGRVLSWYEIDLRVLYLWQRLGYAPDSVQLGAPVSVTSSFIAGSPSLSNATQLAEQMREAFVAMRADGSWRHILARHMGDEQAMSLTTR